MRRPGDQEHDEREDLFGEYPALLTELKVEPRDEGDSAEGEASGGKRPKKKGWRFRLRRRRHSVEELERVAGETELEQPGPEQLQEAEPEHIELPIEEGQVEAPVAGLREEATRAEVESLRKRRKRLRRRPRIGARLRAAREAAERQALAAELPDDQLAVESPSADEMEEARDADTQEFLIDQAVFEEPAVEEVEEPPVEELGEPEEVIVEPARRERGRRRQLRPERRYLRSRIRMVRWLGVILIVTAVGSVAPQVLRGGSDDEGSEGSGPAPAPPDQRVVSWMVQGSEGETFITVLASGRRRPLALAIPSNVTITVPGQSLGTLEEAAAGGDQELIGVALQNVLGVRIDAAVTTDLATLGGVIDAIGGIEVGDQLLDGASAVTYLHPVQQIPLPDEPFLRWQDVLEGMMDAVVAKPETSANFHPELHTAMTASLPDPPDLIALPVIDFGAGVLRVDREALRDLVQRRFVVEGGGEVVRLVVLNGVGTPGIGEDVARILVPEGYLLVSSQNANTFGLKETRIIASSQEDVPAAERAKELLRAGRVYLGNQPGLADVTVVVGRDFGGS